MHGANFGETNFECHDRCFAERFLLGKVEENTGAAPHCQALSPVDGGSVSLYKARCSPQRAGGVAMNLATAHLGLTWKSKAPAHKKGFGQTFGHSYRLYRSTCAL